MKKIQINAVLKMGFLLAAVNLVTGCAAFFQSKVPMNSTGNHGNLGDLLKKAEAITELAAPEQLFVSCNEYSGTINVSWKEVEGASSYRIERAVLKPDESGNYAKQVLNKGTENEFSVEYPEAGEFEVVREFYYDTVYTDSILTNPSANNDEYNYKYFYRIMAENVSEGLEGIYTNPIVKQTVSSSSGNSVVYTYDDNFTGMGQLFKAPCNVNASKGKSKETITLTWDKVTNARYYRVYRDTREDFTSYAFIEQINATNTDTITKNLSVSSSDQGTEFYYKVKAVTSAGQESAFSSITMGYALKAGAPVTPGDLQVVNGYATIDKQFTISWTALEAEEGSTTTYSLYRTTSQDSVFSLVKKDIDGSTSSYTDKSGIKPGIYYYYYIQSVKTDDTTQEVSKSAFSEQSNEAMGFLLSPPASVSVEDSETENCVKLVWSKAIGSTITDDYGLEYSYKIFYDTDKDGTFDNQLGDVVTGEAYSAGYLYAEVQKQPFYKISTIYQDKESTKSSAAAPAPNAPKNVNATKNKNLCSDKTQFESTYTPNTNNVYPVRITWEEPEDGASSYNIYRSTVPDSSFRKLNDTPLTECVYIDENATAKAGVFYYYKVISLNVLGQGTKGNNPQDDDPENGGNRESWGYGALTRDQWFREYNKEIATSQSKLTLMHKSDDMAKLGSETINAYLKVNGSLGTLSYTAKIAGLGAEITMPYVNYADHAIISNGKFLGVYYILNGSTDTTSNMSANGNMHNTVHCYHYADYNITTETPVTDVVNNTSYTLSAGTKLFQGMYPGSVIYDNLEIKGGAAGGGYYLVTTYELDRTSSSTGTEILSQGKVDWLVGEEIR